MLQVWESRDTVIFKVGVPYAAIGNDILLAEGWVQHLH